MEDLQIAFDIKGFQEYFIKYKTNEYKWKLTRGKKEKYYIFEKQKPTPESFGTFLLAFLNTDFSSKEGCKDFIFEYLYVNLLIRINKNIHLNSDIHGDDTLPTDITKISFDTILSEEEIDYYFDEIYTKFKDNLIYYQKLYTAVANFKYFNFLAKEITFQSKENKLKKSMIKESSKTENYHTSLSNIATTTLFLNINFNLRTFFTDKNKEFIIENIPYSFSSKYFYDILFISFREFAYIKKDILYNSVKIVKNILSILLLTIQNIVILFLEAKKLVKKLELKKLMRKVWNKTIFWKYIELEVKHFAPKLQEQNLVLNLKHQKCITVSKKKVLN